MVHDIYVAYIYDIYIYVCTYIYISYTHTVKYYSAIKMNEILPFATI